MRRLYFILLYAVLHPMAIFAIPSPPGFSLYRHNAKQTDIGYVFGHGLRASKKQGLKLFSNHYNTQWIIQQPFLLFDFPDAHKKKGYARDQYVNLGQAVDVERMSKAYNYACKKMPDCKGFVLTGISRGAATCINFVALHQPSKVKALVLETPFDTLQSIVNHLLKRYKLKWMPFSTDFGMKVADKVFEALDTTGPFPIDYIKRIPEGLPVLIVGSLADDVVPIKSLRALYTTLRSTGHEDVYLLELSSGKHGRLTKSNRASQYTSCVHAFYKLYGLPHDESLAQQGMSVLAQCQPELTS